MVSGHGRDTEPTPAFLRTRSRRSFANLAATHESRPPVRDRFSVLGPEIVWWYRARCLLVRQRGQLGTSFRKSEHSLRSLPCRQVALPHRRDQRVYRLYRVYRGALSRRGDRETCDAHAAAPGGAGEARAVRATVCHGRAGVRQCAVQQTTGSLHAARPQRSQRPVTAFLLVHHNEKLTHAGYAG